MPDLEERLSAVFRRAAEWMPRAPLSLEKVMRRAKSLRKGYRAPGVCLHRRRRSKPRLKSEETDPDDSKE